MSTWPERAALQPPKRDQLPPRWLRALHVYGNAPWSIRRLRRRPGTQGPASSDEEEAPAATDANA